MSRRLILGLVVALSLGLSWLVRIPHGIWLARSVYVQQEAQRAAAAPKALVDEVKKLQDEIARLKAAGGGSDTPK